MKYISKSESPKAFELWKKSETPTSWSHLKGNRRVPPEDGVNDYSKSELRQKLLDEQNGYCCYCEIDIYNSSESSIIDHLEPRKGNTMLDRIFDYNNLVLACTGGQKYKLKNLILHCDAAKGNKSLPISPLDQNCEKIILFRLNGAVYSNTIPGRETIGILNLACSKLNNLRKSAINGIIYTDFDQTILISKEEANNELHKIRVKKKTYPFQSSIISALTALS